MKILNILTAGLISVMALPASAATVTYDFANLKLNGANNVGFLPSEVLNVGYWQCSGGDICSSKLNAPLNALGGDLQYSSGGVGVSATGYHFKNGIWNQVSAVQDHDNGYNAQNRIGAGLGVYHLTNDNSDDNITINEKLIMKFAAPVKLSALSLRSDGHYVNWAAGSTFLFNGVSTLLAGDITGLDIVGTEFSFEYGGNKADQFYLGGMTVSDAPVLIVPVPEPSIYALMAAGLGVMLFGGLRRRYLS